MHANPPLPERPLPPQSAGRIRAAIMTDELDVPARSLRRWTLPPAAVLVLIALLATAVVLWPRTPGTQVAESPSASPTPVAARSTGPRMTEPSPSQSLKPGPKQQPFPTDRGALATSTARRLVEECHLGEMVSGLEVLYARRVTDGRDALEVVIYRSSDGVEWICAPNSGPVLLDDDDPVVRPNSAFPVIADPDWYQETYRNGVGVEWSYRALPTIERIQVRAIVGDQPGRWFEAEVHNGFAYLPIFTAGTFADTLGRRLVLHYQHRAFDANGREVAVNVVQ